MKLLDIVSQLSILLPKYTDKFSTTLSISSITASSGIGTIITSTAHGLTTNNAVTLSDVQSETPVLSVTQSGFNYTFETAIPHDLTYGWEEHTNVELSGFTDSNWNDSFTLQDVQNRNNFKIQSTNTAPALNGDEKLLEIRVGGINGRYSVTVIDSVTFTVSGDFGDGIYQGGTISSGVRIAGSVDFERAQEQYTKQQLSDYWMFVVMHDAEISKDRATYSDATATPTQGTDIRLRMIDGFSLFIFKNVTQDIAAQDAVDICRHDLLLPVMQSVFGSRFDSGLSTGPEFRTIPQGHGVASYDGAVYVYTYEFQVSMDLVETDTVKPQDTRAFRDIDFTETVDEQDMTVTIPLEDEIVIEGGCTPCLNFSIPANSQYLPLGIP